MVSSSRWIIAFDASCGACREISAVVSRACADRLEVLPLTHRDVQRWRAEALGADAPWAPTLLRVDEGRAHAWTGPRMALPLFRRLGLRSTFSVIGALGDLPGRAEAGGDEAETGVSRKQFLRFGIGAGVAGGLLFTGKATAFAATRSSGTFANPAAWAKANKATLPQTYDDVVAYPEMYRRAIYVESTPQVRSQLWTEQINRYRTAHPALSGEQASVVDTAAKLAADQANFADPITAAARQQLSALQDSAIKAFGKQDAGQLLATLGSTETTTANARPAGPVPAGVVVNGCGCSVESDYCVQSSCVPWQACDCNSPFPNDCINCAAVSGGCGTFYQYPCDGGCGQCCGVNC